MLSLAGLSHVSAKPVMAGQEICLRSWRNNKILQKLIYRRVHESLPTLICSSSSMIFQFVLFLSPISLGKLVTTSESMVSLGEDASVSWMNAYLVIYPSISVTHHSVVIQNFHFIPGYLRVRCRCHEGYIGSGVGPNGCVQSSSQSPQLGPCATNPCIHGRCQVTSPIMK